MATYVWFMQVCVRDRACPCVYVCVCLFMCLQPAGEHAALAASACASPSAPASAATTTPTAATARRAIGMQFVMKVKSPLVS